MEMKNVFENWQSSLQNYFNLLLYSIKKAVGIYISTIWVQGNSISPFVLLATVWRARCRFHQIFINVHPVESIMVNHYLSTTLIMISALLFAVVIS